LLLLDRFGPCASVHRRSVAPVARRLQRDLLDAERAS
jgi:hypothetical protein